MVANRFIDLLPWKRFLGFALLGCFCCAGDTAMQLPWISRNMALRAIADNGIHAVIGLWCWSLVSGLQTIDDVLQTILCGVLSSAVDLDHFIAAKSFSLKDALSLKSRPPFHATTLIPVIACFLKLSIYLHPMPRLQNLPWIFSVAWFSHHIRDGTRRGLWMWPFGSTPPIPYWLYPMVTMVLPLVTVVILQSMDGKKSRTFATIPQQLV
ncbi:transmembrane protein 267-like [Ptychodera flava]|uniref:transmembrane protein 267-like n=1 Tax=Ptychodera flava TaxID=63121 RepID=UPI00396A3DE4